ncbi:hypothetical protein [Streptomyces griseosporeus]|uniref:hypothetical protein n=1 Tax=Streptomyces griseosporeus TaxID=1910 RepID=UPI0036FF6E88
MTWPTALPGAAARVLCAVAGRRALQVALMVGALCALGFLFGQKAQAAETATPAVPTVTVPTVTAPDVSDAVRPPAEHAPAEDVVRPVVEPTVTSVRERVVRPAGEVAESVTDATAQLPELPSAPALPSAPDLPSLPALPPLSDLPSAPHLPSVPDLPPLSDLPSVPDLPSVSDLPPVPDLPSAPGLPALPAPPTTAPHPASPVSPASPVPPVTVGPAAARTAPAAALAPALAPARTGDPQGTPAEHAAASRHGAADTTPTRLPAPHAPDGTPAGSASGDGGSSRHADAHAVTPCPRLPVLLTAGAVARSGAAEIRDRYRDIPVFPA